jgi:hypothetical protein
MYFPPMSDLTPDALRRTALLLDEEAANVRRAVQGLDDLAGPTTWEGGTPRRITGDVRHAVATARRAAQHLEQTAALARSRAADAALAETLSGLPPS